MERGTSLQPHDCFIELDGGGTVDVYEEKSQGDEHREPDDRVAPESAAPPPAPIAARAALHMSVPGDSSPQSLYAERNPEEDHEPDG